MEGNANPPPEVNSWKEIAHHLGVGIRTAQVWERDRGLPVRRSPSGRVCAHVLELDEWRRGHPAEMVLWWRSWRLWLGVLFFVALGGAAVALLPVPEPVGFRVTASSFVALDEHGLELWRAPWDGPVNVAAYPGRESPLVLFGDVTGDGRPEVFVVEVPSLWEVGHSLRCYSDRGRLLWVHRLGRPVRAGGVSYSKSFSIQRLALLGSGSRARLVVVSAEIPFWVGQVVILDSAGGVLREYWHPGHLNRILIHDLDGDGEPELVLGGVNNDAGAATLVVLDPDTLGGQASASERFRIEGIGPPNERARLVFGRSCVNQASQIYNTIVSIAIHDGRLLVTVNESPTSTASAGILYFFTPKLHLQEIVASDTYRATHQQLRSQKLISHAFDRSETDALRPTHPTPFN